MTNRGHSERHDKRARSGAPRFSDLFQILLGAATGRSHRPGRSRRSHHAGESRSHAHAASHAPQPAVLWKVGVFELALILCIAVGIVWACWRILSDTIGVNLASSSPGTAVAWSPRNEDALDVLAQRELLKKDGDLNAAQAWAERALRANPLDQQALFLLGAIAEKKGDRDRGLDLVHAASERSWRNRGAQLWLFERNATRHDYYQALIHADALFRVDPRFLPALFPTIAAFTVSPDGLKVLADFFVTEPPWRQWVVQLLTTRLYDKSNLDAIFAQLAQTAKPPTSIELRFYLARLIKDQRYEFAYQKWRAALSPQERDSGVPYNGDFRLPVDGQPFNWTLGTSLGFDARIVPSDSANTHALRVQFSGARVDFDDVGQVLLLQPGRYRLTGRVKADQLRTQRGLWWQVSCATGTKAVLVHTDLVSGTIAWSDFHADFEVPSQDCNAQDLRLILPARIASEHEIEGQVWYENLRIVPVPAGIGPGVVNIPSNN